LACKNKPLYRISDMLRDKKINLVRKEVNSEYYTVNMNSGLTNRSAQSYSTVVFLGLVTRAPAKHDAG
jgi:hypothetical protein